MKYFAPLIALFAVSTTAAAEDVAPPTLLSAFFGLDNALPPRAIRLCLNAPGKDGMPVIFSEEIDDETLDPEDFRITTAAGKIGRVDCVTLKPADEKGEKRTALLIGEYGSADDQPATVEIVGDIVALDGGANFKGARTAVIPLEAGPTLILAEIAPQEDWRLGGRRNCPRRGVKTILRVTWSGGVTKPGGAEIDDKERHLYRVAIRQADGAVITATPFAIGDVNDNDNNHELCLGVDGAPMRVSFPAGGLTDPNEDLNPDTEVTVSAP